MYATYDTNNYILVQVYSQVYAQVHAHFDQLQSEQWSEYQHLYDRDDKHLEGPDKHLHINAWVCTN